MIHAFLLSLSLATQGGPVHADLHPKEADVYLELGDASVLLTTLDKAPLLRLLRDERLKDVMSGLGLKTDVPLKDLVQQGLTLAAPDTKPETWLGGIRTVSLSLVAVGPGSETAASVAMLAVADLGTPEQASALHSAVLASAPKHEPMTGSLSGIERLAGETSAEDLWCVAAGSRFVVGNTASKVDDYAARADKKQPGLSTSESVQKQFASLEKASGTPVLFFALTRPVSEILKTTGAASSVLEVLEQIPADLNPLASPRVARMQLLGDRFVTEMFATDVAAAVAAKPVDRAWLEPVPNGQMIVYATAFDGAAAGKRMREMIAKDEESAAALAAIEQKLGFGPERVLARLGPGMTIYSGPLAGMGLPETRLWVDCDDPAAFTADFEALVTALGETLPGFVAKTKPYKVKKAGTEEKIEVPVTTLTLPPGMSQNPMINPNPSFAPVGKKLVFGLGSMDVKNELKRVHSGDGEPIVAGKDTLGAMGFKLPAEATSVFVMDWARMLGSMVGMLKAFAPMLPPDTLPFEVAKLPPPEIFSEFFKPTFHYAKPGAGGTYRRNEASFGPETWFGLMGAGAIIGMRQQTTMMMPDEPPPPVPADGGK